MIAEEGGLINEEENINDPGGDPAAECLRQYNLCGRKRGKEIRGVDYFSSMKSPMKFLKKLQKRGMVRWKAAQKYKCLRPFAWIHGILGLVFYMREKEVTLGDMQKYQQLSAQYSGLHRRLNINGIATLQKDK